MRIAPLESLDEPLSVRFGCRSAAARPPASARLRKIFSLSLRGAGNRAKIQHRSSDRNVLLGHQGDSTGGHERHVPQRRRRHAGVDGVSDAGICLQFSEEVSREVSVPLGTCGFRDRFEPLAHVPWVIARFADTPARKSAGEFARDIRFGARQPVQLVNNLESREDAKIVINNNATARLCSCALRRCTQSVQSMA